METPLTATTSPTAAYGGEFWERLWRTAGIQAVVLFVVAYLVYGQQPPVGTSGDAVASFYENGRLRILIATVIFGMAMLNLLWFAAALRAALAAAGRDGWGAAATAASAALAGVVLVVATLGAALACTSSAGTRALASGLNDLTWAGVVLSSFPRAMLIMAGSFGLWRASLISNRLFGAGVAVVVLVLLGGTTWFANGFWAPDGAYSRFFSPALGLVWVLVASRVVLSRSSATGAGW
jgi:hypothetical protein